MPVLFALASYLYLEFKILEHISSIIMCIQVCDRENNAKVMDPNVNHVKSNYN